MVWLRTWEHLLVVFQVPDLIASAVEASNVLLLRAPAFSCWYHPLRLLSCFYWALDHRRNIGLHIKHIVVLHLLILIYGRWNYLVHAYVEVLGLLQCRVVLHLLIVRLIRSWYHCSHAHPMPVGLRKLILWNGLVQNTVGWLKSASCAAETLVRPMASIAAVSASWVILLLYQLALGISDWLRGLPRELSSLNNLLLASFFDLLSFLVCLVII